VGGDGVVYKGIEPISERAAQLGGMYFNLGDGESAEVFYLCGMEDVTSVLEHFFVGPDGKGRSYTCIGKKNGCPMCATGDKPTFKGYAPIYNITAGCAQVLRLGIKFWKLQIECFKEYSGSQMCSFKISRTGKGMSDTVWHPMYKDKGKPKEVPEDVEIPDVDAMVAPKSKEELDRIVSGQGSSGGGKKDSGEFGDLDDL